MICTPTCSICYKNYSKQVVPTMMQPCGHGNCSDCINRIMEADNPTCPLCRTQITKVVPNYDLIEITENITLDTTFWGRRLMEIVAMPGQTIEVSEEIKPLCKMLCYRIALTDTFKKIKETMNMEQTEEVNKFKAIITKCLYKADIDIHDAFMWLKVLKLPICVHSFLIEELSEWYEIKYFLEKQNASWIINAITI